MIRNNRIKLVMAALAIFLLAGAAPRAFGQSSAPQTFQRSLKDLGKNDIALQGTTPSYSIWLPFQSNWQVQSAELELHYVASPVLNTQRSDLTINGNGVPLTSVPPQADGLEHVVRLTIPPVLLNGVGISFDFNGYLRTSGATCIDGQNPANWLTLLNTTAITLHYGFSTTPPKLSDLPNTLIVQNNYDPQPPVLFVLPDDLDSPTLTVASQVAAWLASANGGAYPIQAATYKNLQPSQLADANVVIVGLRQSLPILDNLKTALPAPATANGFQDAKGKAVPSNQAVIETFVSPWNKIHRALLVSAGSADGLKLAGDAFADRATVANLKNPAEFVAKLAAQKGVDPYIAWTLPSVTFGQLGDYNRSTSGESLFNHYFTFRLPPGWVVGKDSRIVLNFAYSPVLNPGSSYIAAFVNNQPAGQMPIGQGISDTHMVVPIPPDVVNGGQDGSPQAVYLRVTMSNFLNLDLCRTTAPEAAWSTVFATSTISLAHSYMSVPDLQAFPYPFLSDASPAPIAVIVPAKPTNDELTATLEMVALLGRLSLSRFDLRTVIDDGKLQDTQAKANLIVLGTRDRQPLIDQFSTAMLKNVTGTDTTDVQTQIKAPDAAFWQEGVSPWNKDRVALIVSGGSPTAFAQAALALGQANLPIASFGLIALVDSSNNSQIILQNPAGQATTAAPPSAATTAPTTAAPAATSVATSAATAAATAVATAVATAKP
jgi:hypothetical protein